MSLQLQAIASHAGMSDVFRLRAANIYAVRHIERVDGFTSWPVRRTTSDHPPVHRSEPACLERVVAEQLNRAECLGELLETALRCLDEFFGLHHTMLLLVDEKRRTLQTIASRGYDENGVGSEVGFGEGPHRHGGGGETAAAGFPASTTPFVMPVRYVIVPSALRPRIPVPRNSPLPGLSNASTQIAVPLIIRHRCLGVLVAESLEPLTLLIREEAVILWLAIWPPGSSSRHRKRTTPWQSRPRRSGTAAPLTALAPLVRSASTRLMTASSSMGEYLIKNVPGRILWRILKQHQDEHRVGSRIASCGWIAGWACLNGR